MSHEHVWEKLEDSSTEIHRYKCTVEGCESLGWSFKIIPRNPARRGIHVYKTKQKPFEPLRGSVTMYPRSAGTNKAGGYLPPGTGGNKRK